MASCVSGNGSFVEVEASVCAVNLLEGAEGGGRGAESILWLLRGRPSGTEGDVLL